MTFTDIKYWFNLHFKYKFQRANRGSITHLKNTTNGYPNPYESMEEWHKELDSIIQAFSDYKNFDDVQTERLEKLEAEYNIKPLQFPIGKKVSIDDMFKYINNKENRLPSDVLDKFYIEEDLIMKDIKERMKKVIDDWGNLWD